jgi:translation elongation factor EF-Tu-like GTPase
MRALIRSMLAPVLAPLLLVGCGKAPGGLVFAEGTPVPVTLTLLADDGKTGRTVPIDNHYRSQVQFASIRGPHTCAVVLPATVSSLAPGQTLDVLLSCDGDLRLDPKQLDFSLLESGRQVGKGQVRTAHR